MLALIVNLIRPDRVASRPTALSSVSISFPFGQADYAPGNLHRSAVCVFLPAARAFFFQARSPGAIPASGEEARGWGGALSGDES